MSALTVDMGTLRWGLGHIFTHVTHVLTPHVRVGLSTVGAAVPLLCSCTPDFPFFFEKTMDNVHMHADVCPRVHGFPKKECEIAGTAGTAYSRNFVHQKNKKEK